jgi:hypothetical protein
MYTKEYVIGELVQWLLKRTHFNLNEEVPAKEIIAKLDELDKQYKS